MRRIVVVGASIAGLRAIEAARRAGYDGRLTLIGAEAYLPYDRPPLSKEVLRGDVPAASTIFHEESFFDDLGVELLLGCPATALEVTSRAVVVGDERVPFDGIVIATGSSARSLPAGRDMAGVHVLRTLEDAEALSKDLDSGPRVVVVGAGFIGSEVAASARSRGLEVTVVEALDVPLSAALGVELGRACAGLHEDNGTSLRCGVGVASLAGEARVERVVLTDGSSLEADVVVVGIGVKPAAGWLRGSSLTISDGLVCDPYLNAGAPGVFAAGDLVRWHNVLFGEDMRVEHWTNAADQGGVAMRNLLAGPASVPYAAVPYFWSDQYGVRIQAVGQTTRATPEVVHGSADNRRFVALYRRGDRVVGAMGMNSPKLLMRLRAQLSNPTSFDEAASLVQSLS